MVKATNGEGFNAEEVEELGQAVEALTGTTAELANLLQAGNEHQAGLGGFLEGILTGLTESTGEEGAEYVASIIDEVTNTLDQVTDDCDAHHQ